MQPVSKAIACSLVKFLAHKKRATVAEMCQATGSEESNIRTWMYEMQAQGMVIPDGKVDRELKFGRSSKGIRKVMVWKWLL